MKRIAIVISALIVLLVHGRCLFCMEQLRQENPLESGEYIGGSNNDDKTYDRKKEKELLEKGISCYKSEEYLEAIEILQEVIYMNPENVEAIEYLLRSMQANIPSPDIHDELFIRGVRNYLLKEYEAAIDIFHLILGVNPEHGEAKDYIVRSEQGLQRMQDEKEKELLEKGISYYESEEYLEAIEILQEVIYMNPENVEAIEYLLRSMQANIPSPDIHDELFIRGVRNYLLKEYKAAIDIFKTILRVNPEHGEAKDYIVRSEQGLQRMQDDKEKAARKEEERRTRISEADEKAAQAPVADYSKTPSRNKEERARLAKQNVRRMREVVDDFLEYYNRRGRGRLSVHSHYWYDPSNARWVSPPASEWEIRGHDLSGTTATVRVRFPSYYYVSRSRYRRVWIFDMRFAEADNPRNPNCWTVSSIRESGVLSR